MSDTSTASPSFLYPPSEKIRFSAWIKRVSPSFAPPGAFLRDNLPDSSCTRTYSLVSACALDAKRRIKDARKWNLLITHLRGRTADQFEPPLTRLNLSMI